MHCYTLSLCYTCDPAQLYMTTTATYDFGICWISNDFWFTDPRGVAWWHVLDRFCRCNACRIVATSAEVQISQLHWRKLWKQYPRPKKYRVLQYNTSHKVCRYSCQEIPSKYIQKITKVSMVIDGAYCSTILKSWLTDFSRHFLDICSLVLRLGGLESCGARIKFSLSDRVSRKQNPLTQLVHRWGLVMAPGEKPLWGPCLFEEEVESQGRICETVKGSVFFKKLVQQIVQKW